jgi:hypothetical protein
MHDLHGELLHNLPEIGLLQRNVPLTRGHGVGELSH